MAILVERDHIGIFGRMNAGKSSVMNLLTQQETSIVDPTPGTTADTKITLMELHGIGPVKLYDTAGADETGGLGDRKRKKARADLKECDLVLLVVDPAVNGFDTEQTLLAEARDLDKQVLVLYNLFRPADGERVPAVEQVLPLLRFHRHLVINAADPGTRPDLLAFIGANLDSKNHTVPLLPFLKSDTYYVLIIPMDAETPPGRLLRPQAMVEEYITRHWAWPVSFRLDLAKARSADPAVREQERVRLMRLINGLNPRPAAVITDSQAMDVMHPWCPEDIALTTFSITMINYMSRGRLAQFARGTAALETLRPGDRVLIAEACNHSRIGEDIGTVQIPGFLERRMPGVQVEHNFGRAFRDNPDLQKYRLVIHCGACMISPQTLLARIRDLEGIGVPFTNYGLVLARMQGRDALERVLKPWGLPL